MQDARRPGETAAADKVWAQLVVDLLKRNFFSVSLVSGVMSTVLDMVEDEELVVRMSSARVGSAPSRLPPSLFRIFTFLMYVSSFVLVAEPARWRGDAHTRTHSGLTAPRKGCSAGTLADALPCSCSSTSSQT